MGSNDEMENPETNSLPLVNEAGPVVKPKSSNSEELTSCVGAQPLLRVSRKYRMRDQNGHLLGKKEHMARAPASATWLPATHMEGCSKLTLNVRRLKLGTLNMIFRGPVTFSVDYIEITNEVRIEPFELTSCEWCKGYHLPVLFLQMTDVACCRLREQLAVSKDMGTWDGCQSTNQQEKYLLVIFERVPTMVEEATLEEIFTEIGRLKNLNILFKLTSKGGFSITAEDLCCLDEGEFLNDVIMDFYLKYLVCEMLQEEDANRYHVFSSFFYRSLTQNDMQEDPDSTSLSIQERRHKRVRTWTRHLDLFKKDFVFIPINQSAHWYLAVICFPGRASQCSIVDSCENRNEENSIVFISSSPFSNPMSLFYKHQTSEQVSKWSASEGVMDEGFCFVSDDDLDDQYNGTSRYAFKISDTTSKPPCILIMDSLSCGAKPTVVQVLQEYLEMEWRVRKGSLWSFGKRPMKGWSVQVPQQDNHTDCGVYVLQYVESFITNPPKTFHPAMDLRNWFPQKLVKKKRERIKRLIFRLHHQQQAESGE
ncbi:hypothetical protein AMELA_G00123540 [Ameiurus melas]|uniref:Ubiquitin-like protease family profile domain-containing protein n=1 Tax=Ameiurus melas TaxID=219545 RepID=A0A7J6AMK9_AMEME|nr:hypothetical protein AMELA_G00123540 [Ameiurus melas]